MTKDMLCYYNTDTEICLGDRVLYPKLFRKVKGAVVYIPGQSPLNKNMEYGDVRQWGIKLDEKPYDVIVMGYFPPDEVIPKRLVFVARGDASQGLKSDEELL